LFLFFPFFFVSSSPKIGISTSLVSVETNDQIVEIVSKLIKTAKVYASAAKLVEIPILGEEETKKKRKK